MTMSKNIEEDFNRAYIKTMLESFKQQRDSELSHLGLVKKLNDINDNGEKDMSITIAENLVEIKYLLKEMNLIIRKDR